MIEQVNNGGNKATVAEGILWWSCLQPLKNCGLWRTHSGAGTSLKRLWLVGKLMSKQVLLERTLACGGPTLEQILP